MTVTNVPGPQFPLYLLESRMVASYPLVPLWESHGVGIALFSYAGSVGWGFNGDWDLMPDLDEFVQAVDAAFTELLAAARRGGSAAPASPARAPKKRPPLGTRSAADAKPAPSAEKAPSGRPSQESEAKKAATKTPAAKKSAKKASAKTSAKKASATRTSSGNKGASKARKKST
jgi:diacylglycerol O-acyltransferase